MNWSKFGYLSARFGLALGILIILGLFAVLAALFFALLAETIRPTIDQFGLTSIILVPLTFGIFYIGWNLAGHIMEYVRKKYNL